MPPIGDGLTIGYHGLNLGRLALCAGAAGNMRVMLANMLPWAAFRRTYGQAINSRELVKRRIGRLAALIAGADALVAWGSWLIDEGYRGEIRICLINHDPAEPITLSRGDRIAQLVVQRVESAQFVEVDQLAESARGGDGYGSTGGHATLNGGTGEGARK